ncbi:MAG: hypothetical protein ACRDJP_10615 [Actinomycetota bacterium]
MGDIVPSAASGRGIAFRSVADAFSVHGKGGCFMRGLRTPWIRGALTLGVLGIFGAGMLISNVGAVAERREASKKFVKKRLRKAQNAAESADMQIASRVGIATDATNAPLDPGGTTDEITQLTVQVAAPAPGFLVVEGSIDSHGIQEDEFTCFLTVNGTDVPSSFRWVHLGPDNAEENCDTDGAVPVPAGAHTIDLVTAEVNSSANGASKQVLHATYVPHDGAGAPPTSFAIT